eukprot:756360-Hanusia_phi.AAC.1
MANYVYASPPCSFCAILTRPFHSISTSLIPIYCLFRIHLPDSETLLLTKNAAGHARETGEEGRVGGEGRGEGDERMSRSKEEGSTGGLCAGDGCAGDGCTGGVSDN